VQDTVDDQEKQNVDGQLIALHAIPEAGAEDVAKVVEHPER